jgi:hypothetical protein
MRMKLSSFIRTVRLATAASAQQESGPAARIDGAPLREEVQTIEELLPDRGPALFELAHNYASFGDFERCVSLQTVHFPDSFVYVCLERRPSITLL